MAVLEINQKYGRLTALERVDATYHTFRCDCGKVVKKRSGSVKYGLTKSCGCLQKDSAFVDNTGKKYGMLTIVGHVEGPNWICSCECGGEIIVNKSKLFQQRVTNCGCRKTIAPTKTTLYGGDNRKGNRVNYDWHIMIGSKKLKLRSSYEVIYAEYLVREGIRFQYEPKRFKLVGGDYVPDFYLTERNVWVELKGIMTAESQSRIDRFRMMTGLKLVVIGEEEINDYLPEGMNYNKFLRAWKKKFSLDNKTPKPKTTKMKEKKQVVNTVAMKTLEFKIRRFPNPVSSV